MYQPKDPDETQMAAQAKATATAIEWVSRILAIVAVMVLPGLGGTWLDARFGTRAFTLLGFALGLTLGIVSLLAVVKTPARKGPAQGERGQNESSRNKPVRNENLPPKSQT